jgi:hypothetical protein
MVVSIRGIGQDDPTRYIFIQHRLNLIESDFLFRLEHYTTWHASTLATIRIISPGFWQI